MKKYGMMIMVVLTVALLVGVYAAYAAEKSYTGYLSDVLCGENGKDPGGTDLTRHPEKHTLDCMRAEGCAASGYGIFLKEKGGMYKFHKFDEKGSEMAKNDIVDATKKKDHMKIMVMGQMQEDGMMMVKSLKPVK
jgi:hypothetical protein